MVRTSSNLGGNVGQTTELTIGQSIRCTLYVSQDKYHYCRLCCACKTSISVSPLHHYLQIPNSQITSTIYIIHQQQINNWREEWFNRIKNTKNVCEKNWEPGLNSHFKTSILFREQWAWPKALSSPTAFLLQWNQVVQKTSISHFSIYFKLKSCKYPRSIYVKFKHKVINMIERVYLGI